jgi:putative toxin-antitoxin system antitoxin component (TIGR02293 family)
MEKAAQRQKLDVSKIVHEKDKSFLVWIFLFGDKWTETNCQGVSHYNVISCIRSGLPKSGIETFLEKTNVNRQQLSHVLHISTRQLKRYLPEDRLSPEQSNFLYELTRIYTRAVDILGDQPTAEHWLGRRQVALGDHVPLELLDTTEGVRLVDDLLTQIEYGFYS